MFVTRHLSRQTESLTCVEYPDADPLLEKLGGLPLALVQAGAYIGATSLTVEEYVAHYDKTWVELMSYQDRYPLQEYAERSVLTTWRMSYEQVRMVKPEAAGLLDQWAFFHPGDMSYELIGDYTRTFEDSEGARDCELIATNKLSFQDSVGVLAQYSLVNKTEGMSSFSIHAVVHEWSLYNIVDDGAREQLCVRAIRMVAKSIPSPKDAGDLQAARKLLPHARMAARRHVKMREVADLQLELHQVAYFMSDWESSQEVVSLYLRALRGYEEAWGAKHTSTLNTVGNLGNLYADQGKMKEAEEMYLRALRGYEEAWGAKHTSTLRTVNNLGGLYYDQARISYVMDMKSRLRLPSQAITGRYGSDKQVLPLIIQLCSRYPLTKTSLLGIVGRVLLCTGDRENARLAFQNQIMKTGDVCSHGYTRCNSCEEPLTMSTNRFVCMACSDVDLCEACYREYDVLDTTEEATTGCTDHRFLAVPQPDPSLTKSLNDQRLSAWMSQMLQRYPVASELQRS
jgi:tetratricopeptide (TPR) repeat protein